MKTNIGICYKLQYPTIDFRSTVLMQGDMIAQALKVEAVSGREDQ